MASITDQFASRAGTLLARAEEELRRQEEEEEQRHGEETESRLVAFMENWAVEEARRLARNIPDDCSADIRKAST